MNRRNVRRAAPTDGLARAKVGAAAIAILIVLCGCDSLSGKKGAFTIDACREYAAAARQCFGERAGTRIAASLSKPLKDDAAREAMEKRCITQSAHVHQICR